MELSSGINLWNAVTVIIISLVTTSIAEAANYFLIYSKSDYKDLNKEIEATSKKIDALKETTAGGAVSNTKKKKNSSLDQKLQILQRDMTMLKMKSTILVTIFMIVTMSSLGNYYQGVPVARLPFVPFSLLSSITHRGLIGDDQTECSYIFVYLLASYLIRSNIQRIFGFEASSKNSSMMNPFGMPYPTS